MRMHILYLYLLIHLWVEIRGEFVYRSNICIKEIPRNPIPIYDQARGFKDFVENSDVFIDKTLLIKALLEDNNVAIYITCPKKWGKSINLDMLKTFLEVRRSTKGNPIPVQSTWSYGFFTKGELVPRNGTVRKLKKPPLISEYNDLIEKYLGKFPVLRFDFTRLELEENTYDGFVEAFRELMSKIYKRYAFVKKELRSIHEGNAPLHRRYGAQIQLEEFEQYESGNRQVHVLQKGLNFLSELLHSHYRKRVFILIDEPEYPFNQNNFPSDEEKRIQQLCAGFVDMSVTSNTHLFKAVITGVLELSEEEDDEERHDSGHTIRMYNMINNPWYEFYGVTPMEMEMLLLTHLNVPTLLIEQARSRYRGYKMSYGSNVIVYNIWSIVNFANTHRVENFWWRSTGSSQHLSKLFELPEIRKMYQSIMEGKYHSMHHNDTRFTLEEVSIIKKLVRGKQVKMNEQIESLLFSYFLASGYLTMTDEVRPFMEQQVKFVELRLPNEEVKEGIVAQLELHKEIKHITNI